ncbi:MAG TPA: hypothetical protein PKY77_00565 [Phycisphaerae bacterium]|nr:hypothetical protein [Phycisphaerae bacterium]HRY67654.1 hypothetical protein [Phycisphaerae bacterium]HSA25041.1 hypothetical protein [Phycisphaerae bacterium]
MGKHSPLATVLLLALAAPAHSEGFLGPGNTRIVDGRNREVLLRGMGLGGWMLQEGYMLGIKKEGTIFFLLSFSTPCRNL